MMLKAPLRLLTGALAASLLFSAACKKKPVATNPQAAPKGGIPPSVPTRLAPKVMVTVTLGKPSTTLGARIVTFSLVGPPLGTGTVTCTVDGKPQPSAARAVFSRGTATLTLSGLTAGQHTVGCYYGGDRNYSAARLTDTTVIVPVPPVPPVPQIQRSKSQSGTSPTVPSYCQMPIKSYRLPSLEQVLADLVGRPSTAVDRKRAAANISETATIYRNRYQETRRLDDALAALRLYDAYLDLVSPDDELAPYQLLHSAEVLCGMGCPQRARELAGEIRNFTQPVDSRAVNQALANCR
jgi:hypothetical protein